MVPILHAKTLYKLEYRFLENNIGLKFSLHVLSDTKHLQHLYLIFLDLISFTIRTFLFSKSTVLQQKDILRQPEYSKARQQSCINSASVYLRFLDISILC